jgi:tetratricopeptide (TPR) repeat protein
LNHHQRAIEDYYRAIVLDPTLNPFYINRGSTPFVREKRREEQEYYNDAIESNPDRSQLHVNRGNIRASFFEFKEAEADYKRAIELDPEHSFIYFFLGKLYAELGRFEEAIKSYDHAVQRNPDFIGIYSELGHAYMALGKFEEATAVAKEALRIDPSSDNGLWALSIWMQHAENDRKEAAKSPETLYAYNFNNGLAALARPGWIEHAEYFFTRAIEVDPNAEQLPTWEAFEKRAIVYEELGRQDEASADRERAMELKGQEQAPLDAPRGATTSGRSHPSSDPRQATR